MEITGFIWLEKIVDKLTRKHHVTKEEIRDIFRSHAKYRLIEKGKVADENVYSALGQTNAGRYLIVFFIYKKTKEALIPSSRDMTKKERSRYEKK